MSKQTINIVGIEILYNILEEIKDNLPFQLANFNKKNEFINHINENKINKKNSLIITKNDNRDLFLKNNINRKDIFFISEKKNTNISNAEDFDIKYPIEIYTLIENINNKLIKKKYNYQSKIIIKKYHLDLNSKIISYKNNRLKLTEKEMDIIVFLNNNTGTQKINVLQNEVWNYSSELETHTVETHIYRLRKKINDKFKDDNFIVSTDNGYLIE